MKRFAFFIGFILIIIASVNAQTHEDNATKWLNENMVWSQASVEELSFATLVLNSQTGLNQLNNKMDSQTGCFPKNSCNVKDTALATLALREMNQPIDKQIKYLNNSLKVAPFNAQDWNIQIVSNEAGTCTIKYEESPNGVAFEFDENGKLNDGSSWINFNQLNGFNFNKNSEDVNVACNFATAPRISIIKIIGNSFYIIEEQNSKNANFKLKNGCYSINPGSASCDEESSFYASFAMNKLGLSIDAGNYLKDNANTDAEYSILSIIDNKHVPILISKQKEDGSFENFYSSSFAYGAIRNSNYQSEKNKLLLWIESQQNNNGRLGSGVRDTSVALYFVYTASSSSEEDNTNEPGEGCIIDSDCSAGYTCNPISEMCEQETEPFCNTNLKCEPGLGETLQNCQTDCFCNRDNICDLTENPAMCPLDCQAEESVAECGNFACEVGENENNCPLDCTSEDETSSSENEERCGNGECGFGEDENNCSLDCQAEEKSGSLWIWIIIVILIFGGGAFFILTKMKKKGGDEKTPPYLNQRMPPSDFQPGYKPVQRPKKDEAMENELDRSIKEAQDLLRRKK